MPQRDHRIHPSRPPCGEIARRKRDKCKQNRDNSKCERVSWLNAIEKAYEITCRSERRDNSNYRTKDRQSDSLYHDKPQDIMTLRAYCHTYANFRRSSHNFIREQFVESDTRKTALQKSSIGVQ